MRLRFPKKFLWGVGVSAHQTEGNNTNNDWWEWEQRGKTVDKSGWATDSWNRYKIDHRLAADLGCGAYRISLEWSRIELKEGNFSDEALEHYRKVLRDIKANGMKRVVTLCHYTVPLWFSQKYGWQDEKAAFLFARYCKKVFEYMAADVDVVITFNEPRFPLLMGYLLGMRPPAKKNPMHFFQARRNMIKAHIKCYNIIKRIAPGIPVGLTEYCNSIEYHGKSRVIRFLVEKIKEFFNYHFFTQIGKKQDFIGINYYRAARVDLRFPFYHFLGYDHYTTEMGWGVHAPGLYNVVMEAWGKYKRPIFLCENGLADKNDTFRSKFIQEHLKHLHRAIEDGADVRGYIFWSLLDNYEWEHGYSKRFGLCKVDYKTMERIPRRSYYYYQKVIRENGIAL